ncbi:hypothetical protein F511_37652 [Dorcoceras hygrometricum]|uniref:Uncharacterized protein n=1 Tax=Dorcoceras hygrometricum TaxID=472368 RepID=A0A2Z7BL51_9LAMI|nr:hypothetical protein F511_37652 [Dorcoceras hygrometricum]
MLTWNPAWSDLLTWSPAVLIGSVVKSDEKRKEEEIRCGEADSDVGLEIFRCCPDDESADEDKSDIER